MSTLAHVFEEAGIATIVLSSTRSVAERMANPRTLHCEFPLGRPLGKPSDAAFQHDVLARAFALLDATEGPVLVDHPEVIEADETALSCQIPPRFDADAHPAVDEANGIRKAYDRTLEARGMTNVGRSVEPDGMADAVQVLVDIAAGTPWKEAGIPGGNTTALCHDIRTYYEEAALSLANVIDGDGDIPAGRAIEAWYFDETETGKLVLEARQVMKDAEAPFPVWFYMVPGHR